MACEPTSSWTPVRKKLLSVLDAKFPTPANLLAFVTSSHVSFTVPPAKLLPPPNPMCIANPSEVVSTCAEPPVSAGNVKVNL